MKFFLIFVVAAVLGGCMYVSETAEGEAPMRLTAIDVGQGLAVLLEWNGQFAMYDFGPDSVGVVDSLLARGVDTLDWVVLSHNHRDHIGGFMELPGRGVFVRRLYVGPDTACSFFCDSVLRVARALGASVDTILRGESVSFGSGVGNADLDNAACGGAGEECLRFDVLWPTRYTHGPGSALSSRAVAAVSPFPSLGSRDLWLSLKAFPRAFPTRLSHGAVPRATVV